MIDGVGPEDLEGEPPSLIDVGKALEESASGGVLVSKLGLAEFVDVIRAEAAANNKKDDKF